VGVKVKVGQGQPPEPFVVHRFSGLVLVGSLSDRNHLDCQQSNLDLGRTEWHLVHPEQFIILSFYIG